MQAGERLRCAMHFGGTYITIVLASLFCAHLLLSVSP